MRLSQHRLSFIAAIAAATALSSGCSMVNKLRAKSQLNDGAQAYRNKNFTEAQEHFQKALELNPEQPNARLFIARSIHAQYKPGVEQPQNIDKAREAIKAYQDVLAHDPNNDDAYNAVVYLYRMIKDEKSEHDWLMRRATADSSPPEKRSQAYTVLASKDWQCSYNVTEQAENKQTVMKNDKAVIQYKKPKEQKDYDDALKCVTDGLQLANQAVSLDPNSEQAWSFKTNLLLERVKLAKMDGKDSDAEDYQKQAGAAQQRTTQLNQENKRKKEEQEKANAAKGKKA
ncbi:MAG: tetratricopeptide repeat protein [Pyrinomonadaceae bacterium]